MRACVAPLRAASSTARNPAAVYMPATHTHARVVAAGTFDRLHAGHYAMFHLAFAHGRLVEIWVRCRAAAGPDGVRRWW